MHLQRNTARVESRDGKVVQFGRRYQIFSLQRICNCLLLREGAKNSHQNVGYRSPMGTVWVMRSGESRCRSGSVGRAG